MSRSMAYVCFSSCLVSVLASGGCVSQENPDDGDDGFVQIFDGETLDGWDGDPTYWRVEDGALVGEVTPATTLQENSFIIWRGGVTRDFELKVEYRISASGNSGINYRSDGVEGHPYSLRGYQADLDGENWFTGSTYEERRRRVLARQGDVVVIPQIAGADSLELHTEWNRWQPTVVTRSLGSSDSLDAHIHDGEWNEYHIIAIGNHLRHYVNGVLMSEATDNDPVNRRFEGLLGVQVHWGPTPMKVEYRDFRIKHLN